MAEPTPSSQRSPIAIALLAILRAIAAIVLVVYTLFDELLFPLLRPLLAALGRLRLFQVIGDGIGMLPPYVVLVLLAVPFIIIEPIKVFALYWLASGHIWQGPALLVIAQILSILICDRIYHAGRAKLLQIGWFRALMNWLVALRDKGFAWVKATAIWTNIAAIGRTIRRTVVGWLGTAR